MTTLRVFYNLIHLSARRTLCGTLQAKPPVVDMIVRTVPDNADWDDVKHKAVLFGPLDEHRRTIIGADEWHEFKVMTLCVALVSFCRSSKLQYQCHAAFALIYV